MPSRRTVLRTVLIGTTSVFAGCSTAVEGGPEGSADIILVNDTQTPISASVTVVDESETALVSETFDVPVVEEHGQPNTPIEDVFETDGQYVITIAVDDGPSATKELPIRSTEDDADMHQIYIEEQRIEFS
ncbi:hypothetical protein [Halopiger djelfimassiliensis]|uniref:hypothetical protein n=1 Tax=Halopiger djelfimassiliensis TaxID=1293047 RepID=UPI0006776203|nr:hypothetical protein [Halopiger djelfimassiliensis]